MKPTLQSILQKAFHNYETTHPLPAYVRKAAYAIMNCRTEHMGGYRERCPEGDFERIWYHSCRHRNCSKCSYMRLGNWLSAQKSMILHCPHYHTILTIPDSLNDIWFRNLKLMNDTIVKCSRDALMDLLEDRKYMGATPGLKASIQTWTQDLLPHPHTHFIVTGGGLRKDGTWAAPKRKCLLPRKVLMRVFRGKMRDSLIRLTKKDRLHLPQGMKKQQFINLMNKLGRKRWNVKIKPAYEYADGVVNYLGRYLKGGPISNSRFISFDGEQVEFHCRETKAHPQRTHIRLSVRDFLRRLFLHVPLPGAQNFRSYGLYANSNKDKLAQSRELIGQQAPSEPEPLKWRDIIIKFTGKDPQKCPLCGKILVKIPIYKVCHSPPLYAQSG